VLYMSNILLWWLRFKDVQFWGGGGSRKAHNVVVGRVGGGRAPRNAHNVLVGKDLGKRKHGKVREG
jgi:hypothetical protein